MMQVTLPYLLRHRQSLTSIQSHLSWWLSLVELSCQQHRTCTVAWWFCEKMREIQNRKSGCVLGKNGYKKIWSHQWEAESVPRLLAIQGSVELYCQGTEASFLGCKGFLSSSHCTLFLIWSISSFLERKQKKKRQFCRHRREWIPFL